MGSSADTKVDTFHAANVAYALDRTGYAASGRLIFQHYLWKDATDGVIHPRILADIGTTLATNGEEVVVNVADVGAGTGAWALDVARLSGIPGINAFRVHGFDISEEQFPPAHILPDNVNLSVADALGSVPESLQGSFHIVHVAHFAGVRALGDDPGAVIQHALALLKPGGWIQWDEWTRESEVVRLAPSPRCDWAIGVSSKIFPEWLLDIAGHLAKHGFVQTAREVFDQPNNHLLPGLTSLWYLTSEEIVKVGFEEPTRSMFLEALMAAYAETKDKEIRAMFRMKPSTSIGKKPSNST